VLLALEEVSDSVDSESPPSRSSSWFRVEAATAAASAAAATAAVECAAAAAAGAEPEPRLRSLRATPTADSFARIVLFHSGVVAMVIGVVVAVVEPLLSPCPVSAAFVFGGMLTVSTREEA